MHILLAEDDDANRRGIEAFLKIHKHTVKSVVNGVDALACVQQDHFNLLISDVMMPEMSGLQLLQKLNELSISLPMIVITAYATIEDAVKAMKFGAEDYLSKPLNLEELLIKINRLQKKLDLVSENQELKSRLDQYEFPDMIGGSKAMESIKQKIVRVAADPDISVMIYGESGTGKELVARNIHRRSPRAKRPFVAINCAALPDELLESELFGHKRGAFTNAVQDKKGILLTADKGTLFLDELSEMSQRMQAKLLRVLQEHTFQPLGSTQTVAVDIRIVGASNQNLYNLVQDGKFREDLYYRLNVVEINLPPLRERGEDIPILIQHFLEKFQKGKNYDLKIANSAYKILQNYAWPGNIRELENLVKMLTVTCDAPQITAAHLPERILNTGRPKENEWQPDFMKQNFKIALQAITEKFEREYLKHHLSEHNGNISKTAAAIGLSRVALHQKIKQYELDKE